jgi:chemotaxis protein CheX
MGKVGKVSLKELPYTAKDIAVIIGIEGDLQGQAIYTMDKNCGIYLASKLMMGFPLESLDEMAISAIRELGNMISGNAASALFGHGIKVDITPPTFTIEREGAAFAFIEPSSKVICIPLHLDGEKVFEIDLHLKG